jgi:hypothetical protein
MPTRRHNVQPEGGESEEAEIIGNRARRNIFPDYSNGQALAPGTIYQAATDGWLALVFTGAYMNALQVWCGPTSPPGALVAQSGDDINANTKGASICIPIREGAFFKVVNGGTAVVGASAGAAYEGVSMVWYPV